MLEILSAIIGVISGWVLRLGMTRRLVLASQLVYDTEEFKDVAETAIRWLSDNSDRLMVDEIVEIDGDQGTHLDLRERALFLSLQEYGRSVPMCTMVVAWAAASLVPGATGDSIAATVESIARKMEKLSLAEHVRLQKWMDAVRLTG